MLAIHLSGCCSFFHAPSELTRQFQKTSYVIVIKGYLFQLYGFNILFIFLVNDLSCKEGSVYFSIMSIQRYLDVTKLGLISCLRSKCICFKTYGKGRVIEASPQRQYFVPRPLPTFSRDSL